MVKGKFPNGLDEAMTAVGIGPTALGRLIKENKQSVDRWRKGERKLSREMALEIAPHVKSSAQKLLLLPEIPETRVAGRVGAGGAIIDLDEDISAEVPAIPVLAGDPWGAATVSGDSLGMFEGWYAIIGPKDAWDDSLYGKLCVIETSDGETLIKWVEKTKKKGAKLISGNGEVHADGVEIRWAAQVVGMRPR